MAYRRTPAVQARLDEQRTAILAAGAAVLADRGYAACTVAGVAARAGVATGTVYNHFDNKAQLEAELFRSIVGREVDAVRAAVASEATAGGDAPDRVTAVVETFAGRALKHPRRAYALLVEPVTPQIDALRLEFRHTFRDVLADTVAAGVAAGRLPPQNARVVAAALVGAIGEALVGPLSAVGDTDTDPDTVPALVHFVRRAIGATADDHA